jgi:hypothetical protein
MKTANLQLSADELEMLKEELDHKLEALRAEGWDDIPEIFNQWVAIHAKIAKASETVTQ